MIFRLDGVTKEYSGFRALDDVSVEVEPGSIGLLGPNGAGKSTMIKLLLGLVRLTRGRAEVLGRDVRNAVSIREVVGYMPEDDCYIAGLRGVEIVARTAELAGIPPLTALRRAHEMLDYVQLGESRYREVQTYSTGMKQRIRLAIALVHSPQLVFLDEPTSGMDPDGREQMLELVRDLARNKGVSVVISTHILHDVEACCDAAMILSRGKLLRYDTLENLRRTVDTAVTVRIGGGDSNRLATALRNRGFSAEATSADVVRASGEGDLSGQLLEATLQCGMSLHEITPARNSLEKIFLQSLRDDGASHANS
ncbi:MAG: ABC transporter ATP-binding protein [Planctomycetes bacterium]|nr:ABC transporter ATP-binding protein [Planctomycetota bacterium]